MSSTRPKRNNSPISSKHQPLKATVPFQSLLRNPGSPTTTRRRTSPCSPVLPPDKISRIIRKSPDTQSNEHHRLLLSPLGSKGSAFSPVTKTQSANSLETLSSSYMNGQWPREFFFGNGNSITGTTSKSTQTNGNWEDPLTEDILQLTLDQKRQPLSIGNSTGSKEVFRHHLKRTKQQSSQPCHSKQSCVHGDHSAVASIAYDVSSKPVSIPQAPFNSKYPNLHTRRSVEGLDCELEGLDLARRGYIFAETPPEGRRPPVPGFCGKNLDNNTQHTQTSNGWIDSFSPTSNSCEKRSHSLSPSWFSPEKENTSPNRSLSADITMTEIDTVPAGKCAASLVPKYAASPKPNNSFWFARAPPDGAEKVPLSMDDIEHGVCEAEKCTRCPDTTKVTIQFSKDSPFCSFLDNARKVKSS